MKILFFLSALHEGGAQRVVVALANELSRRGNAVAIACKCRKQRHHHPISSVEIIELDLCKKSSSAFQGLVKNVSRIISIRRLLSEYRPDVLVSFLTYNNVIATAAGRREGVPTIVSERIAAEFLSSRLWRTLRRVVYPRASALVTQTQSDAEYYRRFMSAKVIANPLSFDCSHAEELEHRPAASILAVGRLEHQKGFDILLRGIAECAVPVKLTIAGTGSHERALQELAVQLGVTDRVHFLGYTEDVARLYTRHRIFVMTSRYEGYPNALLEAMACGCACISTDCPHGPRDLIEDDHNGILIPVDDVEQLSRSIERLSSHPEVASRFGMAARQTASMHTLSAITDQWDTLLRQVCAE